MTAGDDARLTSDYRVRAEKKENLQYIVFMYQTCFYKANKFASNIVGEVRNHIYTL